MIVAVMLRVPFPRKRTPSVVTLLLANLVPLVGVLAFGWSLIEVMFVFWAESAVIGLFNIAKMIRIDAATGTVSAAFFAVHYGIFMLVHAAFIIVLFAPKPGGRLFQSPSVDVALAALEPAMAAVAAMFVSHGVSFAANFLRQREYERTTVPEQMFAPYKRIMVMQVAIILGGWIIMTVNEPVGALGVLVLLKTGVDLVAHLREHAKKDSDATRSESEPAWAKLFP
jgi:hypothetical protein